MTAGYDGVPRPEWRGPKGGPYPCPCCGFLTIRQRACHDSCPVCWWEDDGQGEDDADAVHGGPNYELSLTAARERFRELGTTRLHLPGREPRDDELPGGPPNASQRALLAALDVTGPVEVETVDLPGRARAVTVARGLVWVAMTHEGRAGVAVVEPTARRVVGTVDLGPALAPAAMVEGTDAIWLACHVPHRVSPWPGRTMLVRLDLATREVRGSPVEGQAQTMAVSRSRLCLGWGYRQSAVTVIDQATGAVSRVITVPGSWPTGPSGIAA